VPQQSRSVAQLPPLGVQQSFLHVAPSWYPQVLPLQ
jgi:hypothetical protein